MTRRKPIRLRVSCHLSASIHFRLSVNSTVRGLSRSAAKKIRALLEDVAILRALKSLIGQSLCCQVFFINQQKSSELGY